MPGQLEIQLTQNSKNFTQHTDSEALVPLIEENDDEEEEISPVKVEQTENDSEL